MNNNEIVSWISNRRHLSRLKVEPTPIKSLDKWVFTGKNIVHEKNSYFSIIGVRVSSKQKEMVLEQPIILQQEVGILGCIMQDDKILLQAKTEPGNVNGTQIAPSVQATVSNYTRAHGGNETKFLRYFLEQEDASSRISDSLQLEHGMRFMNKSNRNSIIRLQGGHVLNDLDDSFRWFETRELLLLLEEDYLVNTDLRSVLVSCNWEELAAGDKAFFSGQQNNGLECRLAESYYQKDSDAKISKVLEEMQGRKRYHFEIKDLDRLKNWSLDGDDIHDDGKAGFVIRGFKVNVADREVPCWEQPLVQNLGLEKVILYCQKRGGILKFLLSAQLIIGLDEALVWGSSIQNTGDVKSSIDGQSVLAECMQSDEGGRFYHSKCLYQVIELPEGARVAESEMSYWASLSEIQSLVMQDKKTTSELRSVLSLLLKFL